MADVKLSALTAETSPTGSTLYILNNSTLDRKITYANFMKPVTDEIAKYIVKKQDTGKTAAYTKTLSSNTKLVSIDILRTAGTPTVTVGTTLAGDELIPATVVTDYSCNDIVEYFAASQIIYVTITGGTVTININVYENVF